MPSPVADHRNAPGDALDYLRVMFGGDAYGKEFGMAVHYLEIVTNDVDTLVGVYQQVHGLSFGPPDPDLGQARVATQSDGTVIGIRKPLAAHEQPILRTYLEVKDIQQATKEAEEAGATIAYPPTRQGDHGTFAILIQCDVEHGLWER